MKRLLLCALAALVLVASCSQAGPGSGSGEDEGVSGAESFQQPFPDAQAYPVLASSEVVVGENRFLVGLLNENDAPIGSPRIDMSIRFFDLERSATSSVSETDMSFIWINKPYQGIYGGRVRFDSAGVWGAEVRVEGRGLSETLKASFDVAKESSTPALGTRPPASDTPTASDVGKLSEISTDEHPEPRFYEMSVADALGANKPFVVAFATPKFCVSKTCGPTLGVVKRVAEDFEEVNFIHVEPYELPADPSSLQSVPAAREWGLPSEPWVFVMDSAGRVTAKYEGIVGPAELRRELSRLT